MALNLINVATITGRTALMPGATSSTAFTPAVVGTAGQLIRINSLYAVNTSATTYTATVVITRSSPSGTLHIASALSCAGNTTTVIVIKDSPIYLEEVTDQLFAHGSHADLKFIVSYEILA